MTGELFEEVELCKLPDEADVAAGRKESLRGLLVLGGSHASCSRIASEKSAPNLFSKSGACLAR